MLFWTKMPDGVGSPTSTREALRNCDWTRPPFSKLRNCIGSIRTSRETSRERIVGPPFSLILKELCGSMPMERKKASMLWSVPFERMISVMLVSTRRMIWFCTLSSEWSLSEYDGSTSSPSLY